MCIADVGRKTVDGTTWYSAEDVCRLYRVRDTRCISKLTTPEQRCRIAIGLDWRRRRRMLYISAAGLIEVARAHSPMPLHQTRREVMAPH